MSNIDNFMSHIPHFRELIKRGVTLLMDHPPLKFYIICIELKGGRRQPDFNFMTAENETYLSFLVWSQRNPIRPLWSKCQHLSHDHIYQSQIVPP